MADPGWPFGDKLPGKSRGAIKNYKTMAVDRIARYLGSREMVDALAVDGSHPGPFEIAKDARLFLWRVHAMQEEALHVMRAWGFGVPVSELVWAKLPRRDDGLRSLLEMKLNRALRTGDGHKQVAFILEAIEDARRLDFGMGRTFRAAHEVCLVGRRGRPARLSNSERSVLFAPGGKHAAAHSQKPEAFFELVERISPGPYLELFSGGHRREGWTCLGSDHRMERDGEPVGDATAADPTIDAG